MRNNSELDVSALWDDLNLGSLLNANPTNSTASPIKVHPHNTHNINNNISMGINNHSPGAGNSISNALSPSNIVQEIMAAHLAASHCPNSLAREKHKKMVEKPTFGVLMDRYQALPHDPIAITSSSIERLADPIKGRFAHYEQLIHEMQAGGQQVDGDVDLMAIPASVGYSSPFRGSSANKNKTRSRSQSPVNPHHHKSPVKGFHKPSDYKHAVTGADSFFLTGADTNKDDNNNNNDDDENVDMNLRASMDKHKQQVYDRVKEILSPKRPSSPHTSATATKQTNSHGINNNVSSMFGGASKYQDPLIKALKKSIKSRNSRSNTNIGANTRQRNAQANKQKGNNNSKAAMMSGKSAASKFTVNGIESKKERRGGKMLHASNIKPLDKSRSEAKLKGRQEWNDHLVPTELLHKQNRQRGSQQRASKADKANANAPSATDVRMSRRVGDGLDAVVNKIDNVLFGSYNKKTGKLPPFPLKQPEDDAVIPKRTKARTYSQSYQNNPLNLQQQYASDSENEQERVMQRCKSSAELRADKVQKVAQTRNRKLQQIQESIQESKDYESGMKASSNAASAFAKKGGRGNNIRSAPSVLLQGLERVDENPLDQRRKKLPGIPSAVTNSNPANTQAASSVRRKLVSDILNSQAVDEDNFGDDANFGGVSSKRAGYPRFSSKQTAHPTAAVVLSAAVNSNERNDHDASDDFAAISKGILDQIGAMDNNISRTNAVTASDFAVDMASAEVPVNAADAEGTTVSKRRTTSEILDSLEKITKASSKDSGQKAVKATKGTVLGTAEIERETDEKAVENLLKFTKRFESKINAAENLSAEYKTLRNGGVKL
jgi:hypothetical protein